MPTNMRLCPVTGKPLPDGFTIHPSLEATMKTTVTDLATLLPHMDDAVAGRMRHGNQNGARTTVPRIPINPDTLERADIVRDSLHVWAHALANHLNIPLPARAAPSTIATLFNRHAYAACRWSEAPAMFDEITHIWRLAHQILDPPTPKVFYGNCPFCGVLVSGYPSQYIAYCPACQQSIDVDEMRAHMVDQLNNALVAKTQALSALKLIGYTVKPKTFDSWVQRGQLVPAQLVPRLYRVSDAVSLARKAAQV